jgi:microcystin degradation protein MlrC
MPAYILIDNNSGYIWSDMRDLGGKAHVAADMTPVEAARLTDEDAGEYGRTYEFQRVAPSDTRTGYHVYRADVGGSDAVTVVHDGQDPETIEAVMRECEFVGFVTCHCGDNDDLPDCIPSPHGGF